MGVFSRKKVTEDVPVEEKRQEEAKTASSVKSVLEGSLLAEKLRQNIRFVLFATFLGIWYISNGYSTEKLHRERVLNPSFSQSEALHSWPADYARFPLPRERSLSG